MRHAAAPATRPSKRGARGFTLVELAIVLGVIAVLTSVAMPALVSHSRGKLGERLVEDMQGIGSAARAFLLESAIDIDQARWPGQDPPVLAGGVVDCAVTGDAWAEMVARGYVDFTPTDPWGGAYAVGAVGRCALGITATVNPELHALVESRLPLVACAGTQCVLTLERPGVQASIERPMDRTEDTWIPANVKNDIAGCETTVDDPGSCVDVGAWRCCYASRTFYSYSYSGQAALGGGSRLWQGRIADVPLEAPNQRYPTGTTEGRCRTALGTSSLTCGDPGAVFEYQKYDVDCGPGAPAPTVALPVSCR